MSDIVVGNTRTYYGITVPIGTVKSPDVPDPRVPYGYSRILHVVEVHASNWVELEFGHRDLAKRVATRLRKHPLRDRYEIILAHDRVFIRCVRADLRDLIRGPETIDGGHYPADSGAEAGDR